MSQPFVGESDVGPGITKNENDGGIEAFLSIGNHRHLLYFFFASHAEKH